MVTCPFCGHDNALGARSCVACGYVFADEPLESGGTSSQDAPGPEPVATASPRADGGREADDAPRHLASLYDPAAVARTVRQLMLLAAIAGGLAVVVAVSATLDTLDALDTLAGADAVFFAVGAPDVAGRADLLALAEHSLVAGVVVMLGGWAQEVGAARSLLGVDDPRRDAGGMLRAFVVPGPDVVAAGRAVRELWADSAPPDAGSGPAPLAVRWFGGLFGGALVARVGSITWGFALADTPATDGEAWLAGIVVVGTRLVWVAALVTAVLAARAVSDRQREQAEQLARG